MEVYTELYSEVGGGKTGESETYSSLVHGRCLVCAALQPPLAIKSGPWTWNSYLQERESSEPVLLGSA